MPSTMPPLLHSKYTQVAEIGSRSIIEIEPAAHDTREDPIFSFVLNRQLPFGLLIFYCGRAPLHTHTLPLQKTHELCGQFTEDGSFIGQYVPGKPPVSAQSTPQNPSLQGANAGMATYV